MDVKDMTPEELKLLSNLRHLKNVLVTANNFVESIDPSSLSLAESLQEIKQDILKAIQATENELSKIYHR